MSKRRDISKAEMEVASTLWKLKSASAREVHTALPASRQIDFSTVQTYLTRLEDKGYIKSRKEGRMKIFSAKASPNTVIREKVGELRDLLFGGDAVPMMRHLIKDSDMSPEGIQALREMLDNLDSE